MQSLTEEELRALLAIEGFDLKLICMDLGVNSLPPHKRYRAHIKKQGGTGLRHICHGTKKDVLASVYRWFINRVPYE